MEALRALLAIAFSSAFMIVMFAFEAEARRGGRFVSSFSRGIAHSGAGQKTYGTDTLTVQQLTDCLKRADHLDSESDFIETDRTKLQARRSQIDNLATELKRQELTLNRYSQAAIDNFNAGVERYNASLADARLQQASFNQKVEGFNQNTVLYNASCAKRYYADDLEIAKRTAGVE